MSLTLKGDRILLGDTVAEGEISILDGKIAEPTGHGEVRDATGLLVLPGIVDIHGDAFERQIQPRPSVAFPLDIALVETDRQMIANGITTAYHGLSVSWEPGLRSIGTGRKLVETLKSLRGGLDCDTKLHIRWETFALDVVDELIGWLADEEDPIFAVNDHTTALLDGTMKPEKADEMAVRMGLGRTEFDALIAQLASRTDDVPPAIVDATMRARQAGARILGHDEPSPEKRRWFRDLGSAVSEFPMTDATAQEARAHGEHTVLGAPNVVRGGSHTGAMDATTAVMSGLCSVLATDYYYPAPLHAAFKLTQEKGLPFGQAWHLISKNPAEACGLNDRGDLITGKRADIVLIDDSNPKTPRVVACFVAGRQVLSRR